MKKVEFAVMNSSKKKDADHSSFETDLEKLETIVTTLEAGKLPLNEALQQFESGVALVRKCEKTLHDAERKIEILVRGMDGNMEAQPFEEPQEEGAIQSPPASPRKSASKRALPETTAPESGPGSVGDFPKPPPEDGDGEDDNDNELF